MAELVRHKGKWDKIYEDIDIKKQISDERNFTSK